MTLPPTETDTHVDRLEPVLAASVALSTARLSVSAIPRIGTVLSNPAVTNREALTSLVRSGDIRIMDAAPRLVEIADAFAEAQLEAILIGKAGAALQGAPVTTLDFDFLYRPSATNETKLRKVAQTLGGHLSQPFPFVSTVYRILRPDNQLQIDLTSQVHGITSFNRLRSQAARVKIDGRTIVVASLADIATIEKQRTARKSPRSYMSSNEPSPKKTPRPPTKRQLALEAMRQASEDELTALIRRQLALPMNKRTNFLRLRLPNGGSCL